MVNPKYTIEDNLFASIEFTLEESISVLLRNLFESTKGFCEFCSEIKHYENFKFLPPEFNKFYYEVKAKYLLKSFSKDLA